jgi:hypothetical protein
VLARSHKAGGGPLNPKGLPLVARCPDGMTEDRRQIERS